MNYDIICFDQKTTDMTDTTNGGWIFNVLSTMITKPVNLRLIPGVRTFKTHKWRKAKETKKSTQ